LHSCFKCEGNDVRVNIIEPYVIRLSERLFTSPPVHYSPVHQSNSKCTHNDVRFNNIEPYVIHLSERLLGSLIRNINADSNFTTTLVHQGLYIQKSEQKVIVINVKCSLKLRALGSSPYTQGYQLHACGQRPPIMRLNCSPIDVDHDRRYRNIR